MPVSNPQQVPASMMLCMTLASILFSRACQLGADLPEGLKFVH